MLLSPGDSDAAQAAGPRWSGRGRQGSRDRRAHELSALRRQNKRPRFRRSDRTFLAAAARRLPRIAIETVWLKRFYVLVFIGARDKARPSRRLHHQPDGAWVTQQARTSPSSSTNEHSRSGFSSMTATQVLRFFRSGVCDRGPAGGSHPHPVQPDLFRGHPVQRPAARRAA
jgi:hypothetical protein